MSEEEIKTMVNNAFKRLSKELEENPDNLINYSKLQEKYIQLLKDKVKLKQENQKYKEVIEKVKDYINDVSIHTDNYFDLNNNLWIREVELLDILKEVEHE